MSRIDIALTEVANLSDRKLKPDHLTLAKLYEMKGEPTRAAAELEQYLHQSPDDTKASEIREAIKKLRAPLGPGLR